MKAYGYILAFYLLLLSIVPCCIFDDCPDDKTEQSSTHEQGDEDCGNCSPFFNCEGCSSATEVYEPIQFDFSVMQAMPEFAIYLQQPLPAAAVDFWQPPKLGQWTS